MKTNITQEQLLKENNLLKAKIAELEKAGDIHKKAEETIKRNLEFQKLISSISSGFVGVIDIDDSINNLLKNIGEFCGASRSYIFRFRNDGKTMDNTHEWCAEGVTSQIDNLQNQPGNTFPWWLSKLYKNEVIQIKDVSKLPEEAKVEKEIFESQDIKSLIVLPLSIFGKLIGFIGFDNVGEAKAWPGETIKILKISSDILANTIHSKEAEAALRESEYKFKSFAEQSPNMIFINQAGRVRYANKKCVQLMGYTENEFYSDDFDFRVLIAPEYLDILEKNFTKNLTGKDVEPHEYELVSKNGNSINTIINIKLIHFESSKAILGVITDITGRKKAEQALKESETRFKALSEATNEAIIFIENGVVIDVNNAASDMSGYSYDEFIGKYATDFIADESKGLVRKNILSGYEKPYDAIAQRKDGSKFHIEVQGQIFEYKGRKVRISAIRDITKRKENEILLQKSKEKLQQFNIQLMDLVEAEVKKSRKKDRLMIIQSKQAAMGEMIGNIAHQWRQPLNDIGLYVQNLQDRFELEKITAENLDETIQKTMDRLEYMSQTIDDFRNFFRSDKEETRFLLTDSINKALSLTEAGFKNNSIGIIRNLEKDLYINGYPNEFSQAVLNILNNAKDVLIERNIQNPYVKINLSKKGKKVILTVSDNGGGINEDIINKIFEPYFTTKDILTGTGQGLYISQTIIERNMSGKLSVSNGKHGARFRIEM